MITLATLNSYASNVAGRPVTIVCEAPSAMQAQGADGYVLWGADGSILNVIHLDQSQCYWAEQTDRPRVLHPTSYQTDAEGQRADISSGDALEVIDHEAMHIALQSGDEGLVECTAWRNRWAMVKQFQLAPWVASMVMAGMTWRHEQSTGVYRTVC